MSLFTDLLDEYKTKGRLPMDDMSTLWLETTKFVQRTARRHYGQPQGRGYRYKPGGTQNVTSNPFVGKVTNDIQYDKHMARMVRFFDFVQAYPERSAKWCLFVWRRRYALIEMVLNVEASGVGIFPPELPFHKRVTHNSTKKLVECAALLRKLDLLPTDYPKLETHLNDIHTKKYTTETLRLYGSYVRVTLAYLFADDKDDSGI